MARKKKFNCMLYMRLAFDFRTHAARKRMEKKNGNQNRTRVAILMSDKLDSKHSVKIRSKQYSSYKYVLSCLVVSYFL